MTLSQNILLLCRYALGESEQYQTEDDNIRFDTIDNETLKLGGEARQCTGSAPRSWCTAH